MLNEFVAYIYERGNISQKMARVNPALIRDPLPHPFQTWNKILETQPTNYRLQSTA